LTPAPASATYAANMEQPRICTKCVVDTTVPGATFDEEGVCNYCKLHAVLERDWPLGEEGERRLAALVEKMKADGRGREHDCIVGVSGGTDSSYLLYLAKKHGLRPLAVHFDNGWDTEISVNNIKKALSKLGLELYTYVVDWEEFKDILVSFMKAALPWADIPTDIGLVSTLYRAAAEEGIKYVIVGNNFRTEGKMPTEWTYSDGRQLKHIQKKFGTKKLKSFPNLTLLDFAKYSVFKQIKMVRLLNFIEYRKDQTREILERELDWKYYGGHHYEGIYTRFVYSYWLPVKFGIDKRKITHSALVRSGEMTREAALADIAAGPSSKERVEEDVEYVIKKLGLTRAEFERIMAQPCKTFLDYPSYYPIFKKLLPMLKPIFKLALPWTPGFFREMDARKSQS
jgi:N-acetyl sugar amidotransferase